VRKNAAARAADTDDRDDRRTDTRNRVLEVAARHFAEHSFQGTSLRAIQREVGVNPATVHYHFGTKEDLYQAVIAQFLDRIQAERLARFDKIPGDVSGRARLERLLLNYLAPHLELATTPAGYNYARILAYVQVDVRDAATDMFDEAVGAVRTRYAQALAALFPEAPERRIYEVLAMSVAHMAMVPIRLGEKSLQPGRMARAIADAVAYTSAGFERLCGPLAE
jgi:TetR/AcrR family transcriptional regulator, regulator of cefoperazone and chloramphenicol sensitivity